MGPYTRTPIKPLNSRKNLRLHQHRADGPLEAQKSWEASVGWNDRVIKIRGKQGGEVKVKVSSKAP